MEQLIYTSSRESRGHKVVASSCDWPKDDRRRFDSIFNLYGLCPEDVPADGILSFLEIRRGLYCLWRTHIRPAGDHGRAAIWVHAWLFSKDEFVAMKYDPISLVEGDYFLGRPYAIPDTLESRPTPKSITTPDLRELARLKPLEIEVLCGTVFCPGPAYLNWPQITLSRLRAIQGLFPPSLRCQLTFLGQVASAHHEQVALSIGPEALMLPAKGDTSVRGDMVSGAYNGPAPTTYACEVIRLLCKGTPDSLATISALGHFADILGDNVLRSGGEGLVSLQRKEAEIIESLSITELASHCQRMAKSARNPLALKQYQAGILVSIAIRIIDQYERRTPAFGTTEPLQSTLQHLANPELQPVGEDLTRLQKAMSRLWVLTGTGPCTELLPDVIRFAETLEGHNDFVADEAWATRTQPAMRLRQPDTTERCALWHHLYKATISSAKTSKGWFLALCYVDGIPSPSHLPENKHLPLLTKQQRQWVSRSLLEAQPMEEHFELARQLVSEGSQQTPESFIRWARWARTNDRLWSRLKDDFFLPPNSKGRKNASLLWEEGLLSFPEMLNYLLESDYERGIAFAKKNADGHVPEILAAWENIRNTRSKGKANDFLERTEIPCTLQTKCPPWSSASTKRAFRRYVKDHTKLPDKEPTPDKPKADKVLTILIFVTAPLVVGIVVFSLLVFDPTGPGLHDGSPIIQPSNQIDKHGPKENGGDSQPRPVETPTNADTVSKSDPSLRTDIAPANSEKRKAKGDKKKSNSLSSTSDKTEDSENTSSKTQSQGNDNE